MATQTTYDTVGVKEDVSDVITDIDPTETPFISSIKDKKITQPFFQWQTDSLAAPATNAQVEGADATFLTVTPSVMLNGYTQILEKAIVISGSTQASEYHGRKDEVAYQIVKRGEEIKRDLEYACIGSNQAGAAGADGTARQLTGYQAQISSNTTTNAVTYGNALSESMVTTTMQNLWTLGGKASMLVVKAADKLRIDGFTGTQVTGVAAAARTRMIGSSDTTVTNVVDLYKTSFGNLSVIPSRIVNSGNALFYEPVRWNRAVLRPWTREVLAKTGDASKQMLVGEFGLIHYNTKASGLITNLSA